MPSSRQKAIASKSVIYFEIWGRYMSDWEKLQLDNLYD